MDLAVRELQGEVKDQLFLEYIKQSTDLYFGRNVRVSITNEGMLLPKGQHLHSSYEFLLPLSYSFMVKIDNTNIMAHQNKLFPINSGQLHGPCADLEDFRCLCLEIDKSYVSELALKVYGKENIQFGNISSEVDNEVLAPIWALVDEYKYCRSGYEVLIDGLQTQIVVALMRNVQHNFQNDNKIKGYEHKATIKKVIDYIRENWDQENSVEAMARIADLSVYHFIRIFKEYTGKTPYEFSIDLKIDKAKEQLSKKEASIINVCLSCGFNNPSHFAEIFKKRVGVTPSKYRNNLML